MCVWLQALGVGLATISISKGSTMPAATVHLRPAACSNSLLPSATSGFTAAPSAASGLCHVSVHCSTRCSFWPAHPVGGGSGSEVAPSRPCSPGRRGSGSEVAPSRLCGASQSSPVRCDACVCHFGAGAVRGSALLSVRKAGP